MRRPACLAEGPILPPAAEAHRLFFPLAAVQAALAVAVWPAAAAGWLDPAEAARLHAGELLLGAFPAMMAGFTLSAVRRWTGRSFAWDPVPVLLALWLLGRAALLAGPEAAMAATLFPSALGLILGWHVVRCRDWRDMPVGMLAASSGLLPLAAMLAGDPPGLAARLSLACMSALLAVLSGRIVPALGRHFLGIPSATTPRSSVETAFAGAVAVPLLAWALWPASPAAGAGLAVAALLLAGRIVSWRLWRMAAHPRLLAMLAGAAILPAGLLLLAAASDIAPVPALAGIHAVGVGGLGLMGLAVMTSMALKRSGRAFTTSPAEGACYVLAAAALALRMLAVSEPQAVLPAALCWCAAFGGFAGVILRLRAGFGPAA